MSLPSKVGLQKAKDMVRGCDRFEVYIPMADCYVEISRISAWEILNNMEDRDVDVTEVMCHLYTEDNGTKTVRLG